jgi:hypothetical protein
MRIAPHWLAAAALGFGSLLINSEARADDILAPSTRNMFFSTGIGPDIFMAICGSGGCLSGAAGAGAMWHNEIGGFFGKGDGAGMAGYLNLGGYGGLIRFGIGTKFLYDIHIIKSFYLEPSLSLGYGLTAITGFGASATGHAADIRVNFAGKLVLGNRGFVYFQPVGLNILGGKVGFGGFGGSATGALLTWVMLFGGGVTF